MTTCPKCRHTSGDDWTQCNSCCPMVGSPHFDPSYAVGTIEEDQPDPGCEVCGYDCAGMPAPPANCPVQMKREGLL